MDAAWKLPFSLCLSLCACDLPRRRVPDAAGGATTEVCEAADLKLAAASTDGDMQAGSGAPAYRDVVGGSDANDDGGIFNFPFFFVDKC